MTQLTNKKNLSIKENVKIDSKILLALRDKQNQRRKELQKSVPLYSLVEEAVISYFKIQL